MRIHQRSADPARCCATPRYLCMIPRANLIEPSQVWSTRLRVWSTLARNCSNSGRNPLNSPHIWSTLFECWSNSAHISSQWANFVGPSWSKTARIRSDTDRCWPKSPKCWSTRPSLVAVGLQLAELGPRFWAQSLFKVGRQRPNLDPSKLVELGRIWAQVRPKPDEIGPALIEVGPKWSGSAQVWAKVCRRLVETGPKLVEIAQVWQTSLPEVGRDLTSLVEVGAGAVQVRCTIARTRTGAQRATSRTAGIGRWGAGSMAGCGAARWAPAACRGAA